MGEAIEYRIYAKNFKDAAQLEEFENLAADWENGEYNGTGDEKKLEFECVYENGWRGCGKSCADLIKAHFDGWLALNPNVVFKATAMYLEQAPIETEVERGEW
jgi:hypothetical protein